MAATITGADTVATQKRRRGNGEGTIFEDKARRRWRGAIAWTDAEGRPRRRGFSGKTRGEVGKRMATYRREIDLGLLPTERIATSEYLDEWLEAERARVRPSTWRHREGHVRLYLKPAFGRKWLADLAPRDVEHMTTEMVGRGLSPRTAASTRSTLRKALQDALRDQVVHRNAAALARPPRVPARPVEYLDRAELRTVLHVCADDPFGPLVALAATTGLRQGELLGLTWEDVDLDARTLMVRRSMSRTVDGGFALAEPKTQRSRRTIYLADQAVSALQAQREWQEAERTAAGGDWQDVEGLVFTDKIGRPLRPWDVAHAFQALLKKAQVRHVPFHALRHSWATLALLSGVPLKVVSDNLGHASITVTAQFYSGIVPELNRDAADAIGRALA